MYTSYIRLKEVRRSEHKVEYYFEISPILNKFFADGHYLVASYEEEIANIPDSFLRIPFVGNTIALAWLTDSDLIVDSLDKSFYDCLPLIKEEYQKMYPDCPLGGRVIVDKIEENKGYIGDKIAQLYTGGMDATATFIKHEKEKPMLIQEYGAYAVFNEDCSFESDISSDKNYNADKQAALEFAEKFGLQAAFIQSNYVRFFKMREWDLKYRPYLHDGVWHGIQHALAILSIASPILYTERICKIYIASSNYKERNIPCASTPQTDNLIRFGETTVSHDGFEMTDEQKAQSIVSFQKMKHLPVPLRVCSWNDRNCCNCEKCIRRMLQINAEGGDPKLFGFEYQDTLNTRVRAFLYDNAHSLVPLNIVTWKSTIERSIGNIENVFDKDVVFYLKNYDFRTEKKKSLIRYYRKNLVKILIRKIKKVLD